jgi:hypothetical protein
MLKFTKIRLWVKTINLSFKIELDQNVADESLKKQRSLPKVAYIIKNICLIKNTFKIMEVNGCIN